MEVKPPPLNVPKKIDEKYSSDEMDDIEVPDEDTSEYEFKYCFQSTTQKPEFTKKVVPPSSSV
jgi:hypothetical protein